MDGHTLTFETKTKTLNQNEEAIEVFHTVSKVTDSHVTISQTELGARKVIEKSLFSRIYVSIRLSSRQNYHAPRFSWSSFTRA